MLVALLLVACGESRRTSGSASAAARDPEPRREVALFAGKPVSFRALEAKLGRPGAPRDLDVRGRVSVAGGGEGRVEVPVRIVCRYRRGVLGSAATESRVAVTSRFIDVHTKAFSLRKPKDGEAFVEAGSNVGWLGDPEDCEIVARLEPEAKANLPGEEERLCWDTRALRAGGCGWPAMPVPSEPISVHDVEAQQGLEDLEVHAHLRVGKLVPSGALNASARCGGVASETDFALLRDEKPFRYELGESKAISLRLRWAGAMPAGPCTLELAWVEMPPEGSPDEAYAAPKPAVPLGTYCVEERRTRAGPCP